MNKHVSISHCAFHKHWILWFQREAVDNLQPPGSLQVLDVPYLSLSHTHSFRVPLRWSILLGEPQTLSCAQVMSVTLTLIGCAGARNNKHMLSAAETAQAWGGGRCSSNNGDRRGRVWTLRDRWSWSQVCRTTSCGELSTDSASHISKGSEAYSENKHVRPWDQCKL